jgi:hypothetical protein
MGKSVLGENLIDLFGGAMSQAQAGILERVLEILDEILFSCRSRPHSPGQGQKKQLT